MASQELINKQAQEIKERKEKRVKQIAEVIIQKYLIRAMDVRAALMNPNELRPFVEAMTETMLEILER